MARGHHASLPACKVFFRRPRMTRASAVFKPVHYNVEYPNAYNDGGFHPFHLGDLVNSRYQIRHKLGFGSTSTVWLARDTSCRRFVALKAKAARESLDTSEEQILQALQPANDQQAPSRWPVPLLLDTFNLRGPNGCHRIAVFEPLGQSLQSLVDKRQSHWDNRHNHSSTSYLRWLSREMAGAVSFVHSIGVLHRDIHLGNFQFQLTPAASGLDDHIQGWLDNLDVQPNDILMQLANGDPLPDSSPQYLVEPIVLSDIPLALTEKNYVKLVLNDFGAASHFVNMNDGMEAYPVAFRPPEILLGLPITPASDIWALGCTIFNLVMGGSPFYVDQFARGTERDDEHLQCLSEVIGPLPTKFFDIWEGRNRFYDEHGHVLPQQAADPLGIPLTKRIDRLKPRDMPRKDAIMFEDLMRSIFRFDPAQRLTADQLLAHPWLNVRVIH